MSPALSPNRCCVRDDLPSGTQRCSKSGREAASAIRRLSAGEYWQFRFPATVLRLLRALVEGRRLEQPAIDALCCDALKTADELERAWRRRLTKTARASDT